MPTSKATKAPKKAVSSKTAKAVKAVKDTRYEKEKARIKASFTFTEHVARTRRISKTEYGYVVKHHKPMLLFKRRGSSLQYVGQLAYLSKSQEFKG